MIDLLFGLLLDMQQPPAPAKTPLEVIELPKPDDRIVYLDARFKITAKTAIFIGSKRITFDAFFKMAAEELYVTELVVKKGQLIKIVFEIDE